MNTVGNFFIIHTNNKVKYKFELKRVGKLETSPKKASQKKIQKSKRIH